MILSSEIGILEQVFLPAAVIADTCEIQLKEDKIVVPGSDGISARRVDIEIRPAALETYDGEPNTVGIGFEKFSKVIKMADSNKVAQLVLKEEKGILEMQVGNKNFELGLVSLDSIPDQPSIPHDEFPLQFSLEKEVFKDVITTADVFADKITFSSNSDSNIVEVQAKGDIDSTEMKLGSDDLQTLTPADVEADYSLSFLSDIVSVVPDGAKVNVKMPHDGPVMIDYKIAEGLGEVTFGVAPWKGSS